MKKFVIILLALVLTLCLVGCDTPEPEAETKNNEDVYIWTDKETGVQYIIYHSNKNGYAGMGGITPRLNADGTLYTEGGE